MIMVLYGTPSHDHADHFSVRRLLGSLHRTRGRGRGIEQPAAPIHFLPHCIQRYRRQGVARCAAATPQQKVSCGHHALIQVCMKL